MAWNAQNHQQQYQMLHLQPNAPEDLAARFHLLPLIEAVAELMERGVRDQQLDNLVNELASQFAKCQQILNSLSSTAPKTVQAAKETLEENEKQLDFRRELLSKLKHMVEETIEPLP